MAETIRLAAAAGLVGASIEDTTTRPADPIYAFDLAVERVRAAAEVARGLPFSFTLTARAENFLVGRKDLADTIARLQAFQDAGAILYNEAILVTMVGSLPIRVGKQFAGGRKLGKTHQQCLVFFKGDPRRIGAEFGEVPPGAFGEVPDDDPAAAIDPGDPAHAFGEVV